MDENTDYLELVTRARLGDRPSTDRLTEMVEPRIFAYIYRLTLNFQLTQDLVQETLLEMVKSLKNLNDPQRFWPWLFRTALGKVQHHFRQLQHRRKVELSAVEKQRLLKRADQSCNEGLNKMIQTELSGIICEAMAGLGIRHRNVLALRCFEQMSYAQIASLMDCTEVRARVLFFHARHSLKQQLAHRGFHKGLLLTALGLFGLMTASTKAASTTTVTAASMEVGSLGTIAGALTTKLGAAVLSLIAAAALVVTAQHIICFLLFIGFALLCFAVSLFADTYTSQ
jgi:RNA polymerase sigma-70 factor (ECF subfamily)